MKQISIDAQRPGKPALRRKVDVQPTGANGTDVVGEVASAGAAAEVEASRSDALLRWSAVSVQSMGWPQLIAAKQVLRHGDGEVWTTPDEWMLTVATRAHLSVDVRRRVVALLAELEGPRDVEAGALAHQLGIDAKLDPDVPRLETATRAGRALDHAVLMMTRYLVLLRMGPAGVGRKAKNRSLKPTNIAALAYTTLPTLTALAMLRWLERDAIASEGGPPVPHDALFSLIHEDDLGQLSGSARRSVRLEIDRMRMLAGRDMWADIPLLRDNANETTSVAGDTEEPETEAETDSHLPFPDEYVSEMGRCSLWLIEELGPTLLHIAKEICRIWERTDVQTVAPVGVAKRRTVAVQKLLTGYEWRDSSGKAIKALPFKVRLAQSGKNSQKSRNQQKSAIDGQPPAATDGSDYHWPPRVLIDVLGLMSALQLAHLFVVGMSMGPRRGELLSLERGCVRYSRDGKPFADGRTFKLEQELDGHRRSWVLPDVAMQAIEQQVRLVRIAEQIGPKEPVRGQEAAAAAAAKPLRHLWAQLGSAAQSDPRKPLLQVNTALRSYATLLRMELNPGGQPLRSHRFRKTVARLVALALTQAPKVLMNVFGHKRIEMTLYYILSDRALQVEVDKVSRELRILRATETVEEMVAAEAKADAPQFGGFGGPAALQVNQAITVFKQGLHQKGEEWGASSARELAEVLTLQGKSWQIVREGVVCTKFPGTEAGACNKSKGHPEPASCQSHCNHRLEAAFLRADTDSAIAASVKGFLDAQSKGEDLLQAHWASQVRAHVSRFPDLRSKWASDPVVRQLLEPQSARASS